jgi:hypothetical protein
VLGTTRTSTLQKELDEVAAEGFRLAPSTVFAKKTMFKGDEIVVAVEKASNSKASYQYLVLSTQLQGTLEVEIEQARAEGYELRRTITRSDHPLVDPYVALLERSSSASDGSAGDQPPDKLVFSGKNTNKLQVQMNEAAAQGYRFTSVSDVGGNLFGSQLMFYMEKCAESPFHHEYQIFSATKASTLEKELNSAAADGFRLVPYSILVKGAMFGALNYLAVTEKADGEATSYEYLLLSTKRESTLKEEIEQSLREGYEVVGQVTRADDNVAFLERSVPE